ncbi:TfoX/Sxy family DNA transformation protein [Vibrio sp. WXL103]|uniref:TfoX/Sxy family DNA transformation protein n=1 Tax=unclassified Vibrio TaxID=2614977 RepID=UPI003EC8CE5F
MTEQQFLDYTDKLGQFHKRAMFGATGLFEQGAMFCQFRGGRFYLRGGGGLTDKLLKQGCQRYCQIKKQTSAMVNYYDVTHLYQDDRGLLDGLIKESIDVAVSQRTRKSTLRTKRLRDLPNMQLTLERMLKKSGVEDVETLIELGPLKVFERVKLTYGNDLDNKLLWKLIGAIEGVHWKVLQAFNERKST